MKYLERININYSILKETSEVLRKYGNKGCEGLVLWLGEINDDNTAQIKKVFTPKQDSIKSENGVGYFVNSETLFNINKLLSDTGLRLLAQVHSHPGRAYHSDADDRYCIVTTEGGFSVVVPNFGFGSADLSKWATYRLTNGTWKKLSTKKVDKIFQVKDFPEEKTNKSHGLLESIKKLLSF